MRRKKVSTHNARKWLRVGQLRRKATNGNNNIIIRCVSFHFLSLHFSLRLTKLLRFVSFFRKHFYRLIACLACISFDSLKSRRGKEGRVNVFHILKCDTTEHLYLAEPLFFSMFRFFFFRSKKQKFPSYDDSDVHFKGIRIDGSQIEYLLCTLTEC